MEKEKIGRFISALRKEKGMTQKELADLLHVSDRTVSKWERGAGLPDASLMIRLSDILGITVNELLLGEPMPEKSYTSEEKADIQKAASVIYQHVHAQEKKLRGTIIATVLTVALLLIAANLFLQKKSEDRILFPPEVSCELLQRDAEIEATLIVDRSDTGVYDYVCSYEMDRYGTVRLLDDRVWQSYTDTVSSEIYARLKELCPGRITGVDVLEDGYLVCAYTGTDPAAAEFTQLDSTLDVVYSYAFSAEEGVSTAFVSNDILYIVSFHGDEEETYITQVDKKTDREAVSSFSYSDLTSDCSENDSTGGFLFNRENMWVKDGILYFAETYHKGEPSAVLAAYDLENSKTLSFVKRDHAHVVMVRKVPERGEVTVLLNPMGYQPLELYVLDDASLEVKSVTQLELPSEYMTRLHTDFERKIYFLFDGDMDDERVAIWFADAVSREDLDDDVVRRILVVYDRSSGQAVWRGRFQMDAKYEIGDVMLKASE